MTLLGEIQEYWDRDAATYDRSSSHHPTSPLEKAAWRAALQQFLPPAPATVLDVGTGTGFLALQAAALGHRVTAVDVARHAAPTSGQGPRGRRDHRRPRG